MFEDIRSWWKNERFNIVLTLAAGLLPLAVDIAFKLIDYVHNGGSASSAVNGDVDSIGNVGVRLRVLAESFRLGEAASTLLQSLFVLFTLVVLIRQKGALNLTLHERKESFKLYIQKNCGLKMFGKNNSEDAYTVIKGTVSQFYYAWIVIWLIWFTYYVGRFVIAINGPFPISIVFNQVMDFMGSSAMLALYLILTNVTVNIKNRIGSNEVNIWHGVTVWAFILALFVAGVLLETVDVDGVIGGNTRTMLGLMLSMYSCLTFILVLGKLNSNYLQIPRPALALLYIYAMAQAYTPLLDAHLGKEVGDMLSLVFPYIMLLGKINLMLVLCWMVDRRRLILFVIHKSAALDNTPRLLVEINKNPLGR